MTEMKSKDYWRSVAVKNGISKNLFSNRVNNLKWPFEKAATYRVTKHDDFAVYKGDDLIVIGSQKECAEHLGVTQRYINWMATPTGKLRTANRKNPEKATTAVRLGDDEDE